MSRMVAIIDDDPSLGLTLADLGRAGIDVSKVNVLSGLVGVRLLDPAGVRHGLRGRFLRWRQQHSYEADLLEAHAGALLAGRHVIYVPVTGEERQRVIGILRARGGHHLIHFRKWTIEDLPVRAEVGDGERAV
jgi:hypothetical protein